MVTIRSLIPEFGFQRKHRVKEEGNPLTLGTELETFSRSFFPFSVRSPLSEYAETYSHACSRPAVKAGLLD